MSRVVIQRLGEETWFPRQETKTMPLKVYPICQARREGHLKSIGRPNGCK